MGSDPFLRTVGSDPTFLCMLLIALALVGCKGADRVTGSPEPPASFGKRAKKSGCPDVSGRYRWPFIEGQAQGYDPDGSYQPRGHAAFFSLLMGEAGELEIRPVSRHQGEGLQFISRPSGPPGGLGRRPPKPNHFSYFGAGFSCVNGWAVVEEHEHPSMEAREEFGGPTRVGARLAVLEDGSLVIGQWRRIYGRTSSILSLGGQSIGRLPVPDDVTWYWSRYQRL
jgi:hypothetical protein